MQLLTRSHTYRYVDINEEELNSSLQQDPFVLNMINWYKEEIFNQGITRDEDDHMKIYWRRAETPQHIEDECKRLGINHNVSKLDKAFGRMWVDYIDTVRLCQITQMLRLGDNFGLLKVKSRDLEHLQFIDDHLVQGSYDCMDERTTYPNPLHKDRWRITMVLLDCLGGNK